MVSFSCAFQNEMSSLQAMGEVRKKGNARAGLGSTV